MSFAERRGISIKQLLSEYTAKELDYWRAWTKREPTELQKVEYAIARLSHAYINSHRKKGTAPIEMSDLVFRSIWKTDESSDSDTIIKEFTKAFKQ